MFLIAIRFVVTVSIAAAAVLGSAAAQPAGNDLSKLSSNFWSEHKAVKGSAEFTELKKIVGSTDSINAAIAEGKKAGTQSIVNVAVDRPGDVAKLLTGIATSSSGAANPTAIATVLAMRTTAKARAAAAPLVAQNAKAQVAAMTANLSTGIAGLPGIYLGDNAQANGGRRAPTPAGYAPVAGTSSGCRTP
jgi:hypothetical protein